MIWNHRIIRHDDKPGNEMYVWFGVHECHYETSNKEIPTSWTEDAIRLIEENPDDILKTLERIKLALEKPILMIDGDKLKVWNPE